RGLLSLGSVAELHVHLRGDDDVAGRLGIRARGVGIATERYECEYEEPSMHAGCSPVRQPECVTILPAARGRDAPRNQRAGIDDVQIQPVVACFREGYPPSTARPAVEI